MRGRWRRYASMLGGLVCLLLVGGCSGCVDRQRPNSADTGSNWVLEDTTSGGSGQNDDDTGGSNRGTSAAEVCVDKDGDGYGSPDNGSFANCPACENSAPNGCQPDCDDTNANIHPGALERCDAVDNDCDTRVDEMDCRDGACPLAGSVEPPQSGTSWGCKTVDGTPQCVLVGNFSATPECESAGQNRWGICGGIKPGVWSAVPEACTAGD